MSQGQRVPPKGDCRQRGIAGSMHGPGKVSQGVGCCGVCVCPQNGIAGNEVPPGPRVALARCPRGQGVVGFVRAPKRGLQEVGCHRVHLSPQKGITGHRVLWDPCVPQRGLKAMRCYGVHGSTQKGVTGLPITPNVVTGLEIPQHPSSPGNWGATRPPQEAVAWIHVGSGGFAAPGDVSLPCPSLSQSWSPSRGPAPSPTRRCLQQGSPCGRRTCRPSSSSQEGLKTA